MIVVYLTAAAVTTVGAFVGLKYTDKYISLKSENHEQKYFTPKFLIPFLTVAILYSIFSVYILNLDGEPYIDIIKYVTAICGLLLSSITDIKLKLIPNVFCVAMICVWGVETVIGWLLLNYDIGIELLASLIGGLFGGGLLLIGRLFSRNGMGMGDVKIMFSLGLLLKFDKVLGLLFWGLVFSLIFGLALILLKRAKMSSSISMAPFFLAGTVMLNIAIFISKVLYGGV